MNIRSVKKIVNDMEKKAAVLYQCAEVTGVIFNRVKTEMFLAHINQLKDFVEKKNKRQVFETCLILYDYVWDIDEFDSTYTRVLHQDIQTIKKWCME